MSASWKCLPINWKPIGSLPSLPFAGMEIAGTPARFIGVVKMSDIYICNGSSVFSPILKAVSGVVGVIITSPSWKAFSKSCLIRVLTFWALL